LRPFYIGALIRCYGIPAFQFSFLWDCIYRAEKFLFMGYNCQGEFMDTLFGIVGIQGSIFEKVREGNGIWQFILSGVILVIGFILLEILWRYVNRTIGNLFIKKKNERIGLYLSGFIPSFRLGFAVLVLRVAETPITLPPQLLVLIHVLEMFLLAIAFLFLLFHLIRMLDLLGLALPTFLERESAQQNLKKLKSFLRIMAMLFVAFAFMYTQKTFFPEWLWHLAWWRYALIVIVIGILFAGGRLIGAFFSSMADALREDEERTRMRLVLEAALFPIYTLLAAIAVYAARDILTLPDTLDRFLGVVVNVLGVLVVVFFAYRLLNVIEYELNRYAEREDTKLDKNIAHLIRMVARIVVIIFGVIYLLQAITGKPMNTLLAGLGIGGLAVALAAQDTLKNLFGSFMIMIDKPFIVGDRVVVEGYDGFVEDIGFRSTRIRTFLGHLIAIPNEKMASANVENVRERPSIRRLTDITITYDTPPDKVERALSIIKGILDNHEGMHPDYPPRVYFSEFNDTSLNIMMIYWYFPPDYWNYMDFSEGVNMKIMRAFEAEGIEFAFPTTTTYLAQDDRRPLSINISGDVRKEEKKTK
jgi:MscS family membrane protein